MELRDLAVRFPRVGRIEAVVLRPDRGAAASLVEATHAIEGRGLDGDRTAQRASRGTGKRQVTLIQAEHLTVVAALMHIERVDPTWLRRNLVVAGLNLVATRSLFA